MYQMKPVIEEIIKAIYTEETKFLTLNREESLYMLMKSPIEHNKDHPHIYIFFCACKCLPFINPDVSPEKLVEDIKQERARQEEMYGQNNKENTGFNWILIVYEEIGEFVKAVNDKNETEMYKELIQVMAVCIQIEEFYRDNAETGHAEEK